MNGVETSRRPGWTAREALACAYCWAEFASPEHRADSPEAYWASITEQARNRSRAAANELLLLAVARGEAVAMTAAPTSREGQFEALKDALGLKADRRVHSIWTAIFVALRARAGR